MTPKNHPDASAKAALMTVDECAARLNVHRTTVYRQLIAKGFLTVVKTGRKTQVRTVDVENYAAGKSAKKAS